jgi:lipoate-protein ligase A
MAVDEALALLAPASEFSPTLRIYRWSTPAVTIGYNQALTQGVDVGFCRAQGIDIVRRPTGGRAVYHNQELTYSVIVPRAFFKGDTILASYRFLARGFLETLRLLGVIGELITPSASRKNHNRTKKNRVGGKRKGADQPACFLAPSMYEIGAGGRKIIGSAQRRYRYCILQQGSFLLDVDWEWFFSVFTKLPIEGGRAHNLVTGLAEVADRKIGYGEAARALIKGFEKAFGARMIEAELTRQERVLAKKLVQEKYSSADWNVSRVNHFSSPKSGFPNYGPERKMGIPL